MRGAPPFRDIQGSGMRYGSAGDDGCHSTFHFNVSRGKLVALLTQWNAPGNCLAHDARVDNLPQEPEGTPIFARALLFSADL